MSNALESIVQELQRRIGQITTQYETQMALLKVQHLEIVEAKDSEILLLKEKLENSQILDKDN